MLCGWIAALLVTIVIVAAVEMVSKTNLPYGWVGNIVVGFIGGVLGQVVLGQWGLTLYGVYVIQTFIGALVFVLAAKWVMGRMAARR
ncbi:MAG: GlsB/YeaQ/YmgE family stress response membrane protein [Anaerolineae bacterium]|nr:GlsB/YeaQ/YmgE family stress response membrane protein [Anaerolineae bacterium]